LLPSDREGFGLPLVEAMAKKAAAASQLPISTYMKGHCRGVKPRVCSRG
jgi:hypothetical protein